MIRSSHVPHHSGILPHQLNYKLNYNEKEGQASVMDVRDNGGATFITWRYCAISNDVDEDHRENTLQTQ